MKMLELNWEGLCKQCGRCCYKWTKDANGNAVHSNEPCDFLDTATGRCKVYENRTDYYPSCIKIEPENVGAWLPEGCAYRGVMGI
jgi:uncharacterized cysteine cluster protein YcgN (CxxCxxCC family)